MGGVGSRKEDMIIKRCLPVEGTLMKQIKDMKNTVEEHDARTRCKNTIQEESRTEVSSMQEKRRT